MSWSCQRCRQPLLLAPSVSSELDLNQSAYDLVQDSFIAHTKPPPSAFGSAARWKAGLSNASDPSDHAENTGSTGADANSLSARLAASSALFDLLSHPPHPETPSPESSRLKTLDRKKGRKMKDWSGSVVIDHPLCQQCTDTLIEIMEQQMAALRAKRDSYLAFEAELSRYNIVPKTKDPSNPIKQEVLAAQEEECRILADEIESLRHDEELAIQELKDAEEKRLAVEEELRAIAEEEKALELEEEKFWSQYSQHSLTLHKLQEQQASLQKAIQHDTKLLERLKGTNVYNDVFCIGHEGGIATINGLRLGRLPGSNVEWNEINAAWGQVVLLLDVVAKKLNFGFRNGYKLVPKGSFSCIYRYEEDPVSSYTFSNSNSQAAGGNNSSSAAPQGGQGGSHLGEKYELFGTSDWQIGKMLQNRRFDHAQVAFLSCLKQVLDHVQRNLDSNFRVPHTINKDKVGDVSIRLQFSTDENWTRALRHTLLLCKVLLTWVVARTDPDNDNALGTNEQQQQQQNRIPQETVVQR